MKKKRAVRHELDRVLGEAQEDHNNRKA
jgi:hypothetical protein